MTRRRRFKLSTGEEVSTEPLTPTMRDLTGRQFGQLKVLGYAGKRVLPGGSRQNQWVCECTCGSRYLYLASNVAHGASTKCRNCAPRKHGGTGTSEYQLWINIKYKAATLGIPISKRWKTSFPTFLRDMGRRPKGKYLVMKDPKKGYFPANCHWADRWMQGKMVSFQGETKSIAGWAREIGISRERMRQRLAKYPVEIALTTPAHEAPSRGADGRKRRKKARR